MAIVQDAFYIPDDIVTGLLTGRYRRIGSVVRFATGPNKGQIVKHLDSIDLKGDKQAQGISVKVLQFIQQHKKEVCIATIGVAVISVGFWGYNKWKNTEPKLLAEFRVALKTYIEAIRQGNMDINIIDTLMKALEAIKQHKDYKKINIQLTTEELGVLVEKIYEYTIKLVEENDVKLSKDTIQTDENPIINLEQYLKIQKKIFEEAA